MTQVFKLLGYKRNNIFQTKPITSDTNAVLKRSVVAYVQCNIIIIFMIAPAGSFDWTDIPKA